MIPVFSKCLADLKSGQQHVRSLGSQQSVVDESTRPIDPTSSTGEKAYGYGCMQDFGDLTQEEDEAGFNSWQTKAWRQWMLTQPYVDPLPEPFQMRKPMLGEGYELNGKKIQIIAKVADM